MPVRLTFLPEGREHASPSPVVASEAAAQADILIEHPCGTRGRCTRCRVRFVEGAPPATPADLDRLSETMCEDGWRLSCQAVVEGEAVVEVPAASRSSQTKSFGPDTLEGGQLTHLRVPRGAPSGPLGLAVDLGSTTVAVALVDLQSTEILAHGSAVNAQVRHGGDLISRIRHAMDSDAGAGALTRALRETVAELARQVVRGARVDPHRVVGVTACGNGAMSHAFAGEDVCSLGTAPYHGSFTGARRMRAGRLGIPVHPDASVLLFPQVASHVGGDTVAAILATGLDRTVRPALLVDLGTNTEIVLATPEGIQAASAAAGPAFEGAEITHGTRAAPGAVDRVSLGTEGKLLIHTVGGESPRGLCGTGLVDATAALLELGVIDAPGRMLGPGALPDRLGRDLAARVEIGEQGNHRFVLAAGGTGSEPVALYARDVRQLQLVKGSILAATRLLLERADLVEGDLGAVHVAGAFGTHLRKWTALRVGLLPAVDPERILLAGDAAAVGARMALGDRRMWERAMEVAQRVDHVELATDPAYTDVFAEAIPFPEGFPAVD